MFAFIINPYSAKKEYKSFLKELKKKVSNPHYIISKSLEDTYQFIDKNKEQVDIFIAVGGDGTISTIAQKLVNTDRILGIFPAGSGNGFANETQFSTNLDELLAKIEKKNFRAIDTFLVNDKFSINVSGAGFDGAVAREFEKTSRGFANYMKTVVELFYSFKPIKITFKTKEHEIYNGEYLMINIANTKQFGNNAYIAPFADITDGLVDIVLVKKFPLTYAMPFVFKMFAKTLQKDEYIQYFSASEIEFELDTDTWHIDGEYLPLKSPIKIRVIPKSLNILI